MEAGAPRFVPRLPEPVAEALRALKSRLNGRYGERFVELKLFGSYARGEQDDESDVDVLVLFADEGWNREELFRDIAELDVDFGVWLSPKLFSTSGFSRLADDQNAFALAVQEEGLAV